MVNSPPSSEPSITSEAHSISLNNSPRNLRGIETRLPQQQNPASYPSAPPPHTHNHKQQQLLQRDLYGNVIQYKDSDEYGHSFPTEPNPNTTLITFQNIGPQTKLSTTYRSHHNASVYKKSNAHISLICEHCLNPSQLSSGNHFHERFRFQSPDSFICINNNTHESRTFKWQQYGGTGFLCNKLFRSQKIDHGTDSTSLSRWTWARFRGKSNTVIRVVSAYRPTENHGPTTTWSQHERYYQQHRNIQAPRVQAIFDHDLVNSIQAWISLGDSIVLGIDANDDVRTSSLTEKLSDIGLRDGILSTHPSMSPPATHNRNITRTPIDAIFVSSNVTITRAGFAPFDGPYSFQSDHRMLWVELDNVSILGKKLPYQSPHTGDKIQSEHPGICTAYQKKLSKAYLQFQVGHKSRKLQALLQRYSQGEYHLYYEIVRDYNTLHSASRQANQSVSRTFRVMHRGQVPWSPKLQIMRDTINFWTRIVKLRLHVNTSRTIIKRLAKKLQLYQGINANLQTARQQLSSARKTYYEAKPGAAETRDTHLQSIIDAYLHVDKTAQADVIKARLKREQKSREMGRVARGIRQRLVKHPVIHATATDEEGNIYSCDTQESLVPAMTASNIKRQNQCLETPFLKDPLLSQIGYLADKPAVIDILNGTFVIPEGTDQYAAELIQSLKMPDSIKALGPVSFDITPEENQYAWRAQKERTGSEPSSPSFAHFKCCAMHHELNSIHTLLRSVPIHLGFSPPAWQTMTDVEILKRIQQTHVDKFRTIQLMDPEFQINNKMLGKRTLAHAEKAREVATDQYGSRKNHTAISACLNKKLLCDILRQHKRSAALVFSDAAGCYDRICHPVAIITLLSYGVPMSVCQSLFQTLQKARHHIKTGFGRTQHSTYGNERIPLQGIGQGNGIGPTLWALISSKLIQMMKKAGHGIHFLTSISLMAVSLVVFAFVDDTDLVIAASNCEDQVETLFPEIQNALDRWSGLLIATGGSLAPEKSFHYLIDFEWADKQWNYRKSTEIEGDFTLSMKDQSRHFLQRYDTDRAEQTLGVYLSMDGNEEKQFQSLYDQSKKFATQIYTSKCNEDAAEYTFRSSFLKTLEYPMPVTQFSPDQWRKIYTPALQATLNRAKLSKKFPRDVLFGTKLYHGLNIMNPYYNQAISHIIALLQESVSTTQTGKLLRATAESFRLELGFSFVMGKTDLSKAQTYITPSWYLHVAISTFSLPFIVTEDFPDVPFLRKHDSYIMEAFIAAGYRKKELQQLNLIRMMLQVVTISDIATSDGRRISYEAYHLIQGNGLRTQYTWPRKPPLEPWMKRIWNRALQVAIIDQLSPPLSRNIKHSLRVSNWIIPQIQWHSYIHLESNCLYCRSPRGWDIYFQGLRHNRHPRFFPRNMTVPFLPEGDTHLVSLARNGPQRNVESRSIFLTTDEVRDNFSDNPADYDYEFIHDAFEEAIGCRRILIDHIDVPDDECEAIAQSIREGSARAVSDGSYYEQYKIGASAFVISAFPHDEGKTDNNTQLWGKNWVPGNPSIQSAYRSELAGIIGVLSTLEFIVNHFHIETGSITLALDGESALKAARGDWKLQIQRPDFDFLQEIHNRVHLLPIHINWYWVRGHQDDYVTYSQLDWWAQRNSDVDEIAKQFALQCYHASTPQTPIRLFHETWSMTTNNVKESSISKNSMYEAIVQSKIIRYWETHHDTPINKVSEVDWESGSKAIKRLPLSKQRWAAKFASGSIGNNHMRAKRGEIVSPQCQLCNASIEKSSHILCCPNQDATIFATDNIQDKMQTAFDSTSTPDYISKAILKILLDLRRGRPIRPSDFDIPELQSAIQSQQDNIGWTNFLLGKWSLRWRHVIQSYYDSISSKCSAKRWVTAIIHKLLLVSWDSWDFRNNKINEPQGINDTHQHNRLNAQIQEAFLATTEGMHPSSHHLINDFPMDIRFKMSLTAKQLWLKSVRLARDTYADLQPQEQQPLQHEREALRRWLNQD